MLSIRLDADGTRVILPLLQMFSEYQNRISRWVPRDPDDAADAAHQEAVRTAALIGLINRYKQSPSNVGPDLEQELAKRALAIAFDDPVVRDGFDQILRNRHIQVVVPANPRDKVRVGWVQRTPDDVHELRAKFPKYSRDDCLALLRAGMEMMELLLAEGAAQHD